MAESNRVSRDLGEREYAKRKNAWTPPQLLPSPKAQPGWAFRWVRTSILGQLDPTNASAKFREGWVPVKAEDHPEIMMIADPTGKFPGSIEIGGLVLCKAPTEMVDARKEWFDSQTQAQVEAVDNNFMRTNDARMPLFSEKRSGITFGRGNK
jgi:hypothetical protein